jgi:hypothetical protein
LSEATYRRQFAQKLYFGRRSRSLLRGYPPQRPRIAPENRQVKPVVISLCIWTLSGAAASSLELTNKYSKVQIVDGRPRRITIHTIAPSQEDTLVLGRTSTDAACEEAAETDYVVIDPPQHGIVCF